MIVPHPQLIPFLPLPHLSRSAPSPSIRSSSCLNPSRKLNLGKLHRERGNVSTAVTGNHMWRNAYSSGNLLFLRLCERPLSLRVQLSLSYVLPGGGGHVGIYNLFCGVKTLVMFFFCSTSLLRIVLLAHFDQMKGVLQTKWVGLMLCRGSWLSSNVLKKVTFHASRVKSNDNFLVKCFFTMIFFFFLHSKHAGWSGSMDHYHESTIKHFCTLELSENQT